MGDQTRAGMETHVKLRIGNRTDMDSFITDSVKMAYDELATAIVIPENQETAITQMVAGQVSYTTPTDLLYPLSLRNNTEDEKLDQLSYRDYDRLKFSTTEANKPKAYTWWRTELLLFPASDSNARVLQIRYVKRLPALSSSSSLTALPREWDEVVIQSAFAKILGWLDMPERAAAESARLSQMVAARTNRINEALRDAARPAAPALPPMTAGRLR